MFRTRYASIKLICSGELWKPTMAHLVGWTDMILMDLRGFQKDKFGCKYELTYLLNNWSFDKTVFLTDSTTDASLFEKTIQEIADYLEVTSPNAGKNNLIVHNYVSHNEPRKLRLEIRPILALMGEIATSDINQVKVEVDREQLTSKNDTPDIVKKLKYLLPGTWVLFFLGLLIQLIFSKDGMLIYSGTSIMWLGLIAILATRRVRLLVIRDGNVTHINFFGHTIWTIIITILVLGWLLWYIWVPLQN